MTSSFILCARDTAVASRDSIGLAGMIQIEKTVLCRRWGNVYHPAIKKDG